MDIFFPFSRKPGSLRVEKTAKQAKKTKEEGRIGEATGSTGPRKEGTAQ